MKFDDMIKQLTDRGAVQITISPMKDGKMAVGVNRNGTPHGDSNISPEAAAASVVAKLDAAIAKEKEIADAKAKAEADAKAAADKAAAEKAEKAAKASPAT